MRKNPSGEKVEDAAWPPKPNTSEPKESVSPRWRHWGSLAVGLASILFSMPTTWLIVSVLPYHNHIDGSPLSFDPATSKLLYAIYWGMPLVGFMLGFFSRSSLLGKIGMVLAVCIIASGFLPPHGSEE